MKSNQDTILAFPHPSSSGRRRLLKELGVVLRHAEAPAVIDVSSRQALDHADIDLLLECVAQTAGRDKTVVLVAGSSSVRILLEVTRIASIVPVFDSIEEALDYLEMPNQYQIGNIQPTPSQQLWSA
jgi:ABC-type transporter Mla MlaB component